MAGTYLWKLTIYLASSLNQRLRTSISCPSQDACTFSGVYAATFDLSTSSYEPIILNLTAALPPQLSSFSMLSINPGRELSTVLDCYKTKTKMKTLPQRLCTHWGFYWRCAVMQDAYSTALQTMYILMLDPYLSWRVLGHSVNKSHVILHDSPLFSQSPWPLVA